MYHLQEAQEGSTLQVPTIVNLFSGVQESTPVQIKQELQSPVQEKKPELIRQHRISTGKRSISARDSGDLKATLAKRLKHGKKITKLSEPLPGPQYIQHNVINPDYTFSEQETIKMLQQINNGTINSSPVTQPQMIDLDDLNDIINQDMVKVGTFMF